MTTKNNTINITLVFICAIIYFISSVSLIKNDLLQTTYICLTISLFSISTHALSKKQYKEIILACFYFLSGIHAILNESLLMIIIALSIMSVCSAIIVFISSNNLKNNLIYVGFHTLSEILMLMELGKLGHNAKLSSIISNDNYYLLCGLLINIAIPPFSYWMLKTYHKLSSSGLSYLITCTTKINIILILKIFVGNQALHWVGIITLTYGIIFAILENNLYKLFCYVSISQIGLILIGIKNHDIKESLMIINTSILYTPLCVIIASYLKETEIKHKYEINWEIIKKSPYLVLATTCALITLFGFPFTSNIIAKHQIITNKELITPIIWIISMLVIIIFPIHTIKNNKASNYIELNIYDKISLTTLSISILIYHTTTIKDYFSINYIKEQFKLSLYFIPFIFLAFNNKYVTSTRGFLFDYIQKIISKIMSTNILDKLPHIELTKYLKLKSLKQLLKNYHLLSFLLFGILWMSLLI